MEARDDAKKYGLKLSVRKVKASSSTSGLIESMFLWAGIRSGGTRQCDQVR
jgi:hypothetical protein